MSSSILPSDSSSKGNRVECESGNGNDHSSIEDGTGSQNCGDDTAMQNDGNGEEESKTNTDPFLSMDSFLNSIRYSQEDSLIVYDLENMSYYGVIRMDDTCYEVMWYLNNSHVVMVDLKSNEMRIYDNGVLGDCQYTRGTVDLDVSGRRWEGGVKDGEPFGYGVMYSEEGKKEYEGFMVDGRRVCYGMEFYDDIERLIYRGCYCSGERFGKGILFDRDGVIKYCGLLKSDLSYSLEFDGKTIDNHIKSVEVPEDSFNQVESVAFPYWLRSLKQIVIGKRCFHKIRLFKLSGLDELESVMIGDSCLMLEVDDLVIDETVHGFDAVRMKSDKRTDGLCQIMNCPKLKSIQMDDFAFSDYCSFEVKGLPSLQSIEMGEKSFFHSPSFSLAGFV